MITFLILDWARPENVKQILTHLAGAANVDEIIVWNNNIQCAPSSFMTHSPKITLIDSTRDMSLFTRFAADSLARNEATLYHDDDVLVPHDVLVGLEEAWKKDPSRIYGLMGRIRRKNGSYSRPLRHGDCPIILTTTMIAHRRYASMALQFRDHPEIGPILATGKPYGNGEDMVISYVAMRESGKLNHACAMSGKRLPQPHAICRRWPHHFKYRDRLLKALDKHVIRLG